MASYLEWLDTQLSNGVNPTDAHANAVAAANAPAVVNPDGNPTSASTTADIAPVNEPIVNTSAPEAPTVNETPTVDMGVTSTATNAKNVVAADVQAAGTAIAEGASQANLFNELSAIDSTQVETRIDNAVANQKEFQAIGEAQMVQKQANEEEYQQKLRENQEAEIEALRIQQDSENVANQAAATDMRVKTEKAERELQIANDIALQKSSIAFAKLGLSFSWAAINQAQEIFTTWMYNLSSLKSSNAKNYADLQVKINSVQFDHIRQIGTLVVETAEKEFASKERLRQFIGDTQNNILKDKKDAQKEIQDAITTYKTERQAREDKLYTDMNNANSNLQKATKDIEATVSATQTSAKKNIDMLINNGQWSSLSVAQKNELETAAGIPVGTTANTITSKTTASINDRLKDITWTNVVVPPVILAKMHTEIKRSMDLGVPMNTATQQVVDKYANSIPAVKAAKEAAALKGKQTAAEIALTEAKTKKELSDIEIDKAKLAIDAKKAASAGGGGGSSTNTKFSKAEFLDGNGVSVAWSYDSVSGKYFDASGRQVPNASSIKGSSTLGGIMSLLKPTTSATTTTTSNEPWKDIGQVTIK